MKVLVAGGSGTIGRPLTERLVARGHEVEAMTRSAGKREAIERLGARAVVADALDRDAVRAAVAASRPEAIVHQLTALPPAGPLRLSHMDATNRLRTEGTDHLVDAARACGVRRIVGQSIVFIYGYRDHGAQPIDETRPPEVGGRFDSVLAPLRYMEDRLLRTEGLEGVALRYGIFYSADSPSVQTMARMLRRRMMRLPGGGAGVSPFIHLDDAAEATVLALEDAPAGRAYNVVDDEPASWKDFVGEVARRHGTPPPGSVPLGIARLALPYAAHFMARVRLPVSNARARDDLGWAPAHPTYREGLAARDRASVPGSGAAGFTER